MATVKHTLGTASTSHHPDLDWSQIAETVTMLALSIAQIETGMNEGDKSVNQLTDSFTELANHTHQIVDEAMKLSDDIPREAQVKKRMLTAAEGLGDKVQKAVVAFQFYDRLTQRLNHTSHTLESLGHLVANPEERYMPKAWQSIQDDICSIYTMEAERNMFEHIMRGHSVAEALEIFRHQFDKPNREDLDNGDNDDNGNNDDNDEIELF